VVTQYYRSPELLSGATYHSYGGKCFPYYYKHFYFVISIEGIYPCQKIVFSISVELESDNICVSVCPKTLGIQQSPRMVGFGWNLGKYLGCFFIFFHFYFWDLGTILGPNWAKTFDVAYRAQKWLDLVKILYTRSLGEYLRCFFMFW